jgi:hypothetical protein
MVPPGDHIDIDAGLRVKQRRFVDYLTRWKLEIDAAERRKPTHVVKEGKTSVLLGDGARQLVDTIKVAKTVDNPTAPRAKNPCSWVCAIAPSSGCSSTASPASRLRCR